MELIFVISLMFGCSKISSPPPQKKKIHKPDDQKIRNGSGICEFRFNVTKMKVLWFCVVISKIAIQDTLLFQSDRPTAPRMLSHCRCVEGV